MANAPEQPPESVHPSALALVHEGWHQLRLQRPLAAWACWQRALREDPDDQAAKKALDRLENAQELPAAARAVYRFQTPPTTEPERRARWNEALQGRPLDDLEAGKAAFTDLATADPTDPDARLNLALCRAWLGRNTEAIADLERAVELLASTHPERAASAWTLAEVLRLGAGAELLADDFRYAWVVPWPDGRGAPPHLLTRWPDLVPVALPSVPVAEAKPPDDAQAFEWLDRPVPNGTSALKASAVPRVIAAVVSTSNVLRLSTPDPSGFVALEEPEFSAVAAALSSARRERTPLEIAWADAAVATFRLPRGLDDDQRHELARAVVEHYFEDIWIHQNRVSLDGRTPLGASARAADDDTARAKLEGVVRFREQLGSRPTHAAIYIGYPFDRLRRRLGLITPEVSPATLDAADFTCASDEELDGLDVATLGDRQLADALDSAAGLRDDRRTARFAAEIARRGSDALAHSDPQAVFAPLVRVSLKHEGPDRALEWLDRALETLPGPFARTFMTWKAEVQTRAGRPDEALATYRDLLARPGSTAAETLASAETLLSHELPDQAGALLKDALARALSEGDDATSERARDRLIGLGEFDG